MDAEGKEKIKKLFTRNIVGINPERILNINDSLMLNQWFEQKKKENTIRELTKDFNPDVHVIATKEQLDITNQIKALTGIAKKVDSINEYVDSVKALNTKVKSQRKSKAILSKEEKINDLKKAWMQPKKRF